MIIYKKSSQQTRIQLTPIVGNMIGTHTVLNTVLLIHRSYIPLISSQRSTKIHIVCKETHSFMSLVSETKE